MEIVNSSGFPSGWTLGFEPDGRELLVIAVKATYRMPDNGEELSLATEQVPLFEADEFTGEPGSSATLHETDYAHRKPRCDVLLNGSAYAPGGEPTDRVRVSLRVGSIQKSFYVFGDRRWEKELLSIRPTNPDPFIRMPITYDRAYGGADVDPERPDNVETYRENPIGVGYYPMRQKTWLEGKPLANTADTGEPAEDTNGKCRPMAYGAVGRNFHPRYEYAGTYDQQWLEKDAPFWPIDFSYLYFQAAPSDQQIPYLTGGEEVTLENLTPDGLRWFHIPRTRMPMTLLPYHGKDIRVDSVCDTLLLEPDDNKVMLTWRVAFPLRRNCFELKQIIVGEEGHSRQLARKAAQAGKVHYRSLAELVDAKRRSRRQK